MRMCTESWCWTTADGYEESSARRTCWPLCCAPFEAAKTTCARHSLKDMFTESNGASHFGHLRSNDRKIVLWPAHEQALACGGNSPWPLRPLAHKRWRQFAERPQQSTSSTFVRLSNSGRSTWRGLVIGP